MTDSDSETDLSNSCDEFLGQPGGALGVEFSMGLVVLYVASVSTAAFLTVSVHPSV